VSLSEIYKGLEESETPFAFKNCKTCRWYAEQSPSTKADFDRLATNPNTNQRRLLRSCATMGLDCVPSSFANHIETHHPKIRSEVR